MGLSRLSNFLKNVKGNIIYVDPNSLDSTDNIENQGNSLTRPFKTIQRALIEAARFSYQRGKKNDRFLKTTILLYPGEHYIDNRPGWIPTGENLFALRNGLQNISATLELDFESNFDILDSVNDLYKFNSVYGGVIIPRGTSIVGMDLRKTKIKPLFVPDPENDNIERSAIFRVTGGCYFWQFTILDGDPNGTVFKDYTTNETIPNFSHHKLTVFEYADGVNNVKFSDTDDFLPGFNVDRNDLQIYYEKIGLAYGSGSGRNISPDFPSEDVDIESVVDEFRVVGSKGLEVEISQIFAGNGVVSSTEVTVVLSEPVPQISVDTPIQISNVTEDEYNGQFAVSEVIDDSTFKYTLAIPPAVVNANAAGATASITVDTVSSASPYIFNCSLRSVFGLCGLHADGSKATGFRSMVVAQYTGIGLQKDDNAFVRYDKNQGIYVEGGDNAHTNSLSRFKPEYENFHIKASNNAFLQLVSVFAIGFANHFLAESGGDHSITNSNSNFGAKSLISKGFRDEAFIRDDCGYITHIIAPKEIDNSEQAVEYLSIDVEETVNGANSTESRIYLADQNDLLNPPNVIINGYRFGAFKGEKLYLQVNDPTDGLITVSAQPVMGDTQSTSVNEISNIVGEKKYRIGRSTTGINSITNNVIEFDTRHAFRSGESVVLIANSGTMPDGVEPQRIYYVDRESDRTVKLTATPDDAFNGVNPIVLNNKGGVIDVISRVNGKKPGETGSPLKYDGTNNVNKWYILCNPINNEIFTKLDALRNGIGGPFIGETSSRTYVLRKPDKRSNEDKIYKFRYVLPKQDELTCRPPIDGYVLQNTSDTTAADDSELSLYFSQSSAELVDSTKLRKFQFISNTTWASNTATITTELPHNLNVGSLVTIYDVKSSNNTSGKFNLGFNGTFEVTVVSGNRQFSYILTDNPGEFENNTNQRTVSGLPRYVNRKTKTTYQLFTSEEIQSYEKGKQDGIYYITVTNASNSPSVTPFRELSFSQPIQNLYPQLNRDNPNSNPESSYCFALPDPIGQVAINDFQRSITKETLDKALTEFNFAYKISNVTSTTSGIAHTIYTEKNHGLNGIKRITITEPGSQYTDGTYYNVKLVGFAGNTTGEDATAVVTVDSGEITEITIMNGGSAYGIGNTLGLVGVSTGSAWVPSNYSYITVNEVVDSVGDVISLSGISSHLPGFDQYNQNYVITGIDEGNVNAINVDSEKTIIDPFTNISGTTNQAFGYITGQSINVTNIDFTPSTGIATLGFTTTHPFKAGSVLRITGAAESYYNNKNAVVVNSGTRLPDGSFTNSQLSVSVDIGKTEEFSPVSGGSIKALPTGYTAKGGDIDKEDDYSSARLTYSYDNYTGFVANILTDTVDGPLEVYSDYGGSYSGLNLGDYLLIGSEIVRVSQRVTSNNISILRGLLGTKRETHQKNAIIQRIKVYPVEFRRNSIIRASGHTFEYLGFGPGNYSTGLPERQDRVLTPQEEVLSQATKIDGGTVQYTGMNSDGDFYNNNRKLTSTGQDQIFEAPIPTVTGEEPQQLKAEGGYNLLSPSEIVASRSIQVDGGEENNIISEFSGPVILNEKVTSTSPDGLELRKMNIRGDLDISREVAISTSTPTKAGNVGDIVFNATPSVSDNAGWIYARNESTNITTWQKFGWVNDNLYGVGVGFGGGLASLSQEIDFQSTSININVNTSGGISTVTLNQSATSLNQVGVVTGTDTTELPALVAGVAPPSANVPILKFLGTDEGFGFNVDVVYGENTFGVGIATIKFSSPIVPLNFGNGSALPSSGLGQPSINTLSPGTRVIYDNKLDPGVAGNFAVGRFENALWYQVPQDADSYGWEWYAGSVAGFVASLKKTTPTSSSSRWIYTINGDIIINGPNGGNTDGLLEINGQIQSTVSTGTAPFTVNSTTTVSNLSAFSVQNVQPDEDDNDGTLPVRQTISGTVQIDAAAQRLIASDGSAQGGSYYEGLVTNLEAATFNITNGAQVSGITTLTQVSDVVNLNPTDATQINVNFAGGPVARFDGSLSLATRINIQNVPTTPNRTYNYTVVINATSPTNIPTGLAINNSIVTSQIRWLNNNTPSGSGNPAGSTYIVGFTFFCDGSGSFTTPGNTVLGVYGTYS